MTVFGIDPEEQAATGSDGRLERPWTVFIFGVLLSLGATAVIFLRSSDSGALDDKKTVGVLAFAGLAVVLSGAYAYLGARYNKDVAQRVVGIAGLVVVVGGLAVLLYALLVLAP